MGRWLHYLPIHDGSTLVLIRCSRSFERLPIDKYLVNTRPIEIYAFVHKRLVRCAKKIKSFEEKTFKLNVEKFGLTNKLKLNITKEYQSKI